MMFRQVSLVQCKIVSAVKCWAVANSWVPHHQHHHYSTTTEDDSHKTLDQYPKTYDPTTYRLSFDPLESSAIMDVLNNATMQHLATCGIGKGMASRLLKYRERIGGFQELSQLLEVDRLGIKGAEDVCKSLLQHCGSVGVSEETSSASSSLLQHDMADLETLIGQKRLVKPQLSKAILKTTDNFVALHVTAGFLSWVLCGADGQIYNLATHTLLTPNSRFDALRIYEKVLSVTQEIPEADFYVWEDRTNHGQLAKAPLGTVMVALQLAQIRGMLIALLGSSMEKRQSESQSCLLFLKDSVVPKLFRLKMGGDRLSGLGVADKLMDGQQVMEWLSPVTLKPEVHNAYFSEAAADRRYTAAAVLVAVAFHEVILSKNIAALRILSQ
ncbi:uncharacterized protein LOC123499460 isoform X2 [Portunus trituberculatus]|uniref:uncharacterized protein LOC123499460 isoform X2 n=1 Tax=Portunus trituberculatus TaxID=210409 RepID=UPI001E1CB03F|nr:uncharacterized protein LOC123499460 isoform X2 [Portunus trituberculatus]